MPMLVRIPCLAAALLAAAAWTSAAAQEGPRLASVSTRQARTYAGEVLNKDGGGITIQDLKTNIEVRIEQKDVLKIQEPITIDEAARIAGLPNVIAWQIRRTAAKQAPVGKVARITATTVYVTLGKDEISPGQELTVYRRKDEILDPDTGEVLAVERPLIAKVVVTEVDARLSKVKIVGDVEVELQVGDEVSTREDGLKVAVCPIYHESGELSDVGSNLAEDVTTLLVQQGITVVERSVLNAVLVELVAQNTILFDANSAQNLGKLTGASVVVAGKIVPSGKTGKAYMRLIDVETAEILQAASASVSLANAKTVSGRSGTPDAADKPAKPQPAAARNDGKRKNLSAARALPAFLRTKASYRRHPDGGIIFADRTLVLTKDGTFLTKDFTFEVVIVMSEGDGIAFIGLGQGEPPIGHNEPGNAVNLRFHAPDNSGEVLLARNITSTASLGTISRPGTHLVRIVKEGDAVTFMVDVDNDGPTDDDMEFTIPDIKQHASFLNSKNTFLFFGGGGRFVEVQIEE
jgi:hypothetical protein